MKKIICLYLSVLFLCIHLTGDCEVKMNTNLLEIVRNTIIEKNIRMGDGVRIAIVDSGVNSKVVPLTNYMNFSNETNIEDRIDHGMPIYNIIKNDDIGIAINSEVFCLKVIKNNGFASIRALEEALLWCLENNIDIINLSLSYSIYDESIESVIEMLIEKGVIIVAAINNNTVDIDYPAIYDGLIAVGYTENQSNYNQELSIIFNEVYSIETISYNGSREKYVGNSFFAPIVTGVVACLVSDNKISMQEGKYVEHLVSQTKEILFPQNLN